MCTCAWFCMKRKKNRKVRKLFPQSFPLLFLSLPETRERDAHTRQKQHARLLLLSERERETSEGKRERDVGPGDDQRSLLFLLRGKAVVEDQSPLARPGRGVRVFLVRDGTLCCSDAQACSFLFSALRSSLVFFFFFFFFVLESLLAR